MARQPPGAIICGSGPANAARPSLAEPPGRAHKGTLRSIIYMVDSPRLRLQPSHCAGERLGSPQLSRYVGRGVVMELASPKAPHPVLPLRGFFFCLGVMNPAMKTPAQSAKLRHVLDKRARFRGGLGWCCEHHPTRPTIHDGCGGAGMPCRCNPEILVGWEELWPTVRK